jgi:hypothetical protein
LFFSVFGGYIPAKGEDTLAYAKRETLRIDPLPLNQKTYTKFKKQRFYDYYQTRIKNKSWLEELRERFNRLLDRIFNKTLSKNEFNTFFWIFVLFVFIVIGMILYFGKSGIFYGNKKNPLIYSVEEEDIENQDLDYLTECSIQEKRFSDAIRWQYLKTLKTLHEQNCISYEAHKTVIEYAYEIKDAEIRNRFKALSREFIYYRYGKGEADAEKFDGFRMNVEMFQKMQISHKP